LRSLDIAAFTAHRFTASTASVEGDALVAVMPYARVRYRVDDVRVVSPTDLSVLRHGRDGLVLSATHPVCSDAKRIVVSARRQR